MPAPFRLPATPRERIAALTEDRDFCLAIARENLDRAERFQTEIKRIEAELAERAARKADLRAVRKLAGGNVRIAEE
jgi:hypothetical protein